MSKASLPTRGLAFGAYPQRASPAEPSALDAAWRAMRSRLNRCQARPLPAAWAQHLALARQAMEQQPLQAQAQAARLALRRQGLAPAAVAQALVLAARAAELAHGLQPYDTQLQAAWLMLTGHLVEMATGEGKTLATALAAAVAGLAGSPVHVVTVNDYLVARDAQAQGPLFALLGLRCGAVTQAMIAEQRAAAWRLDIVYTTARELAFDYLRDHLALRGDRDARLLRAQAMAEGPSPDAAYGQPSDPGPVDAHGPVPGPGQGTAEAPAAAPAAAPSLPGLCFALIDEADSVLLDEAVVPLLLARQVPASEADVQAWQHAYALAGQLYRQRHYQLPRDSRQPMLTDAGRQHVAQAVQGESGLLHPPRRAFELVEAALAARRAYRRDRDYVVVNGTLQLIDSLTGRIADGRQWQGALHAMVEIKEGLAPSHPTQTAAQITYQRFFPRYLHLGGMSGTLREARHELQAHYGCPVAAVPLAKGDHRRWLGRQVLADADAKWAAVLAAVRRQHRAGRPVLVGTDSVAESLQCAARLQAAGLAHQVLNATQDTAEAEAVARAGRAGAITVATNIAGRGTDIRLDAAARANGGLHVIATMANRSRRIDRQLVGRAARHGDPGSAEAILALDDALPRQLLPLALRKALAAWARRQPGGRLPAAVAAALVARLQRRAERQDRQRRAELRLADQQADALFGFGGGIE